VGGGAARVGIGYSERGHVIMTPGIRAAFRAGLVAGRERRSRLDDAERAELGGLSQEAQREIRTLLAKGLSDFMIGEHLGVSAGAIKYWRDGEADLELYFAAKKACEQARLRTRLRTFWKSPFGINKDQGMQKGVFCPPGLHLWKLAEFFCTRKTYDSVFYPLLADFHHEYFDALNAGLEGRALWLRVLYCGAFFKSAGLNVAMRFLREAWARFLKA
jgi:hypothetical protein